MADKKVKVEKDVEKWLQVISDYDTEFKRWEGRTDKILKRYTDERGQTSSSTSGECRFPILWSNVQTLFRATFARLPQPDVQRRFRDQDPVGRVASMILERGLEYEIQHYTDYRTTMREDVMDRFLGGRGSAWVRYEPHFKAERLQLPPDGVQVTEDAEPEREEEQSEYEVLDYECAPTDYVHWRDFGHTVARTWEEVTAVWRHVYLGRKAVDERFPKFKGQIPLDSSPDTGSRRYGKSLSGKCAHIIEIWDKSTKKAIWISKALGKVVDERDDPLGLEDFFPCPRPLYATLTTESLIPVPDFTLYQDQANGLDILAERIDGLVKALQVKGVYDSSQPVLSRLFTEGTNGTLLPVNNWAAFVEKNGLKGALDLVDLRPIAEALRAAYEAFQQLLHHVYDITGMADIIRGQSQASETATAQQIKGQFASLRLKGNQEDVALFATELIRLKAQVMVNKFDPMTLAQIAAVDQLSPQDQQLVGPALQLLFGERMVDPDGAAPNPMRNFRIEIAADSLIIINEQEEKQARTEFLTSVGGFMKNVLPAAQAMPQLAPLVLDLMKFTVATYKAGKQIEGQFDQIAEQLKQAAAQPKPPQVPPEVQVEQMKQNGEKERLQAEMAAKAQEHANEMAQKDRQHNDNLILERQKLSQQNPEGMQLDDAGNVIPGPLQVTAQTLPQVMAQLQQMTQLMGAMMQQMAKTAQVAAAPRRLARHPVTGEKIAVPDLPQPPMVQ